MLLLVRTAEKLPESLAAARAAGLSAMGFDISQTRPATLSATLIHALTHLSIDGLLLTSTAALPALSAFRTAQPKSPLPPVYAIGEATAAAALKYGFQVAYTGQYGGADLAADLAKTLPEGTTLLHLAGDHAKTDWHALLERHGVTVRTETVYTTSYAHILPRSVKDALCSGHIRQVALFSAEGARHFFDLCSEAAVPMAHLRFIAFSSAVAAGFPEGCAAHVMPQPRLECVLGAAQTLK